MNLYTLGFIFTRDMDDVLLLRRRKDPFSGKWHGVGGKIKPGENHHDAILREVKEETGIDQSEFLTQDHLVTIDFIRERERVYVFGLRLYAERPRSFPTEIEFGREGRLKWWDSGLATSPASAHLLASRLTSCYMQDAISRLYPDRK